jgi:predicted transcriptional regulator
MDPFADIDLDSESVWLDGAWYTREDLARRIKEMIEARDFRVSRPSQALERLEAALALARVVTVRMPSDLADAVTATATRLGRPVGHLVREAVAYYLAAAAAYGARQDPGVAAPAPAGAEPAAVDVDLDDRPGGLPFKKAR